MNIKFRKITFLHIFVALCILASLVCSFQFSIDITLNLAEKFLHRSLRNVEKWTAIINKTATLAWFSFLVWEFLILTEKGYSIFQGTKERFLEFFKTLKEDKKLPVLAFILAFLFIAFFKIMDSSSLYQDDIVRNAIGKKSWVGGNFFISQYLSMLIHNNEKLQNIAPLTQLLSIVVMAVSVVMLDWILNDKKITFIGSTILTLCFISPIFSQCFSYHFDNPYMTLSIYFSIVPFLFVENPVLYCFNTVICILCCCSTYQSSTSNYILFATFFAVKMLSKIDTTQSKDAVKTELKKIGKFIAYSVISFAVALLMFKLVFMIESENDYFSSKVMLSAVPSNIAEYIKYTFASFGGIWTKIFLVVSAIVLIVLSVKKYNGNKLLAFAVILGALIFTEILGFGPYLVFERPLWAKRAIMAFNIFAALVSYGIFLLCGGKFKAAVLPVFAMIYGCIVYLFTLGNCYQQQKDYLMYRTSILVSDLNEFVEDGEVSKLSFNGSMGYCASVKIAAKNYPKMTSEFSIHPNTNNNWNEDYFNTLNFNCENGSLTSEEGLKLLKKTYYHDIYVADKNNFYIILKDK